MQLFFSFVAHAPLPKPFSWVTLCYKQPKLSQAVPFCLVPGGKTPSTFVCECMNLSVCLCDCVYLCMCLWECVYGVGVSVCVFVCVHGYTCRSQSSTSDVSPQEPSTLILRQGLSLEPGAHQVVKAGRPPSPRIVLLSLQDLQAGAPMPSFSYGFWKSNSGASCLPGNHVTNRAIFSASCPSDLNVIQLTPPNLSV